ncbi:GNAT family N-acetyltransferase [uncultured Roseobacter sp.]|uniref:GNAT family N-acetyltransferase n=1 Tax=uncultured Roseobacter sp. TaxID=114847 RepID=UPI002628FF0A|nr:GNAT family N-acetyltransferase [uncultured Roseobacter sp.]
MTEITIREFTPQDRDWVVAQHAEHYAAAEGFDATFGALVGQIVDGFVSGHDPVAERGWIAQRGEMRLGSIFCVRLDRDTAKLRLFLLVPQAREQGLGGRLLTTCMGFARDAGYGGMQLWTHESHAAACALYQARGWQRISSKPVHSFGQDLVEQSWVYRFLGGQGCRPVEGPGEL